MTTIEKMDFTLDKIYAYKHKRRSVATIVDEIFGELTVVDVGGCIEVLEQDGYIREFVDEDVKAKLLLQVSDDEAKNHYRFIVITMRGMLFKEQGGYVGQQKREERLDIFQKRNTIVLTIGSVIAACGAIGLLIFEYLKLKENQSINFLSWMLASILFVFGLLAGLSIKLIVQELLHRKQ